MIHIVRFILGVIASLAVFDVAMAERIRKVPGTTVSVSISDNFREQEGLAGLVDPRTSASLVVTELPIGAFPDFESRFSSLETLNAATSRQRIVFNTIDELQFADGQTMRLAHGVQETESGRFDKWMAVVRGAKTSVITVQVVEKLAFDPEMVRAVYSSVILGDPPSLDELVERLPFKLDIVAPFRAVMASTGFSLLLMIGEDDLNSSGKQPFIMIIRQFSNDVPQPLDKFAEAQLRSTSSFFAATISQRAPVEFANSEGIFIEGDTERDGVKLKYRQYFSITDDGKFFRLVGVAPADEMEYIVPLIEKIAASVRVK